MTKNELIFALKELDRYVENSIEIVIIGGAAMVLYYGSTRATSDIDTLVSQGRFQEIRMGIMKVSEKLDLPENWLNESAKGFVDILPPDFVDYLISIPLETKYLKLYVLGLAEQTAMKIVALRERDLADLELLIPQLTDFHKERLIKIVENLHTKRKDWALRLYFFMIEKGWRTE